MCLLDFKCPICGGTVTCELSHGRGWASLDFRCRKCGEFCDVLITPEAEEAKESAMDYFNSRVRRIEGDE